MVRGGAFENRSASSDRLSVFQRRSAAAAPIWLQCGNWGGKKKMFFFFFGFVEIEQQRWLLKHANRGWEQPTREQQAGFSCTLTLSSAISSSLWPHAGVSTPLTAVAATAKAPSAATPLDSTLLAVILRADCISSRSQSSRPRMTETVPRAETLALRSHKAIGC